MVKLAGQATYQLGFRALNLGAKFHYKSQERLDLESCCAQNMELSWSGHTKQLPRRRLWTRTPGIQFCWTVNHTGQRNSSIFPPLVSGETPGVSESSRDKNWKQKRKGNPI